MSFTEEEVRRAADLKLWIDRRIRELQEEVERLKETLVVIDAVLRKSSFKTASDLGAKPIESPAPAEAVAPPAVEFKEVRPIKRARNGYLMANAYISANEVDIIPASDIKLSVSTPPFRSFFLNRILEGMKGKDAESVSTAGLRADQVLEYRVDEEGGIIKKIAVRNYRDKTRLNEIINTATWVFTRMLEKRA